MHPCVFFYSFPLIYPNTFIRVCAICMFFFRLPSCMYDIFLWSITYLFTFRCDPSSDRLLYCVGLFSIDLIYSFSDLRDLDQHTWDRLFHRNLCFLMLSVSIVPLRLLWEVSFVKVSAAGSSHLIIRMLISVKFYIQRFRPPFMYF